MYQLHVCTSKVFNSNFSLKYSERRDGSLGGITFRNIHRKTSAMESFFYKVAGLKVCIFLKRYSNISGYFEIFKSTFSTEHLRMNASEIC